MKLLENICSIISGVIIFIFIIGIIVERFQYVYNGFFNTYGIFAFIIAMVMLSIPYVAFYLQMAIDDLRRKSR